MYITDTLINFLNSSKDLSNSTIILTDLEKVIFVVSDLDNNYLNCPLSDSLKQVLHLYSVDLTTVDYINTRMNNVISLFVNDNALEYKSQIILPIVHDDIVEGLLIFFTKDRNYLPSNLKFAKTTKHFVEIFSTKKYL